MDHLNPTLFFNTLAILSKEEPASAAISPIGKA